MEFCPKLKTRIKELEKTRIKELPLVSIIMTFFNEEKNIEKALDSLKNQTYKRIEIILVNDKSTDKSMEVLNNYFKKNNKIKHTIIENEINLGTYKSKNIAINKANGFLITYLDADDEFFPEKIEKELTILLNNHTKKVVFTKFKRIQGAKKSMRLYSSPLIYKKVYDTIGNFIETRFSGDSEYWTRVMKIIPHLVVQKGYIYYRANYCENKNHLTDIHKDNVRRRFRKYFERAHREMKQKPDLLFNHKYVK